MPRLVIVDPAYATTVGHHGEVNRPLLQELSEAGWQAELWADVALEAIPSAPQPLQGVFSGCGYEDPRHWRELGGMLQLARRLEQQLELAANPGPAVEAWLAHSLLPFQLLGLARYLSRAPAARVLVSLMFAPGETLGGGLDREQATANARVALAALGKACRQQGHRLTLACSSQQHQSLYAPLLSTTGLPEAPIHPAVVGPGSQPDPAAADATPLVLLHWGDLKAGKGQHQALALLQSLLEQGVPTPLQGWGWLWHQHSAEALTEAEVQLLQRAETAGIGLVRLEGEVGSAAMHSWLAQCPLALLAYDPQRYQQRSSGMLWQWAASRMAIACTPIGSGVGFGEGWLAVEAQQLGLDWQVPTGRDGAAWLAAVARAAAGATSTSPATTPATLSPYGHRVLGESFASWCRRNLEETQTAR